LTGVNTALGVGVEHGLLFWTGFTGLTRFFGFMRMGISPPTVFANGLYLFSRLNGFGRVLLIY
jgi:hypothetical protein